MRQKVTLSHSLYRSIVRFICANDAFILVGTWQTNNVHEEAKGLISDHDEYTFQPEADKENAGRPDPRERGGQTKELSKTNKKGGGRAKGAPSRGRGKKNAGKRVRIRNQE